MGNKKTLYLAVAALAALSVVGIAVGSYVMNSPAITVTVSKAECLGLGANRLSLTEGEVLTLTATVSDQRNGIVISFYEDGALIGQATTSGGGIATLEIYPTPGTHTYTATGLHP